MCLHPKCRAKELRHYIVMECDEATPEEARKLLDEHKKNQQRGRKYIKKEGKKLKFGDEEKSNTIQAVFVECEKRWVCADSGSDVNLLPPDLLGALLGQGANVTLKTFRNPAKFGLAAQTIFTLSAIGKS